MNIAKFSVNNPVFINLLMGSILIVGFLSALRLPLELFPSVQIEMVTITTAFQGASAEDVEQLITIPIEDEINDLSGIRVIRSQSSEGRSYVVAELEPGEDTQKLAQDIRSEIAKIRGKLPDDIEEPIIKELKASFPLINVSIAGDVPKEILRNYALDLKDRLKLVSGVDNIVSSGLGDPVFWVYINPYKLEQYNISLEDIARLVNQKNIDLPGGTVQQGQVEFLVRTTGRVKKVEDLLNIPVRDDSEGKHILLKEIASVELGEEKTRTLSRNNGLPSINLWINKQKDVDSIKTVEKIRSRVDKFRSQLPESMEVYITNDTSYWVDQRFNTMVSSGVIGLIIVLIILAAFLSWKAALMAGLGIPISFFGAFILMQLTGTTLNILSMFGLILVLGIIVDDAIIVAENIQRYIQDGLSPKDAAIKGAGEVALPVIATILTNIAAFIPLLIATGLIGKFMSVIPKVAIFALLVSMVEALLILPSHCADVLKPHPPKKRIRAWVYKFRSFYLKALTFTIRNRYITVGCFLVILIMSLALFVKIPMVLFYSRDIAQFTIRVENPAWSSIYSTQKSVEKIEGIIEENVPSGVLKDIISMIGIDLTQQEPNFGDHLATIIVEFEDFEKRKENGIEIMNDLREKVSNQLIGPLKVDFKKNEGPPAGKGIDFTIRGKDFDSLKKLALNTEKFLKAVPGVFSVSDDLLWGKPELKIIVDEQKAAIYGLDTTMIARGIRAAGEGLTVSTTRLGREEADIVLKYNLPSGNIVDVLGTYKILTPGGAWVPLESVVDIDEGPSMLTISRYNMERSVRVVGEINQDVTTSREVNSKLSEFLDSEIRDYPGYSYLFRGEAEQNQETIDSIKIASVIAVCLIYLILASVLKSYTQPLIIISVLPFALIGVAVGTLLRGDPISFPTLIGTVALLGIVVNDSLILMNFINNRFKKMNRIVAVVFSSKHRFRPIILTTLTTFGGLFTLMIKTRGEAAFLAPMAIALGFGLVFATLITLFLIPCLYLIVDDTKIYLQERWAQWRKTGEEISGSIREKPIATPHN